MTTTPDTLSTILTLVLGAGGATFLLAIVSAIRKYKSGEIVDDDAVILRLNKDNENLRLERDEAKIDAARSRRRWFDWQEQAVLYRLQLVSNDIVPNDQDTWKAAKINE